MPTPYLALLFVSGGLLAIAFLRLGAALWRLFRLVEVLEGERGARERDFAWLKDELDLRIRRLLARESYWRNMVERQMVPAEPEPQPEPEDESPLSTRTRLRGY